REKHASRQKQARQSQLESSSFRWSGADSQRSKVVGREPGLYGGDPPDPAGEPLTQRYLKGECPETVPVGEPFSLLASIVQADFGAAALKPFYIPATGRKVLLVVHAPGMRLFGPQRQMVLVPGTGDSERVMFELLADMPGPKPVSITAWMAGNYLGELVVEVTAERFGPRGPSQDVIAEIAGEYTRGAVSLVVRYDPGQQLYRFEFRDEDNPDEVTSHLAYDPGPHVEQLVAGLDNLAKDRTGYSPTETREHLVNVGAGLWHELVPAELREQFWQRRDRIKQLTILSDKDIIPWELLYPKDPGNDNGFLVQQFPV